jgi:hypothetical protein
LEYLTKIWSQEEQLSNHTIKLNKRDEDLCKTWAMKNISTSRDVNATAELDDYEMDIDDE